MYIRVGHIIIKPIPFSLIQQIHTINLFLFDCRTLFEIFIRKRFSLRKGISLNVRLV